MKFVRLSLNLLAATTLMLVFAGLASAQATRTWVSGVGDDVNPCSRTAPCKTFAGAISKTATGGEINCLDSGGFGAVTITKSLKIDCGTLPGGILAAGTNGIIINGVGATVIIRGLEIFGILPPGTTQGINGIRYLAATTLHLENVHIAGFTNSCVEVAATANAQLTMNNVGMSNCGTAAVKTNTTVGTVVGDFRNIHLFNSGNGINAQNGSRLSVTNAQIAFCNPGINQSGLTGGGSTVMVESSELSSNGTAALQSVAGASITAFGNTFAANALIFNTNGGSISSGGDNAKLTTDAVGSAPGVAGKI